MPLRLKAVLLEINAERIYPIHTESADLLARFMRDSKSRVTLVEKGRIQAVGLRVFISSVQRNILVSQ
jgi:hypothetical protein